MLTLSGGLKETGVIDPGDGKMELALPDYLGRCRLVCACQSKSVSIWTGQAQLFLHGLDVLRAKRLTCSDSCSAEPEAFP